MDSPRIPEKLALDFLHSAMSLFGINLKIFDANVGASILFSTWKIGILDTYRAN